MILKIPLNTKIKEREKTFNARCTFCFRVFYKTVLRIDANFTCKMVKLLHVVFSVCLLIFITPLQGIAQMQVETGDRAYAEGYKMYTDRLFEQSIHAFDKFRRIYPDHINVPDAHYYQAQASLIIGREDEAVNLFNSFQENYPTHPLSFEARLALGKYYYATGEHAKAITTLSNVVASNPPDEVSARALYWMGESATNLDNLSEAVSYFERAAMGYPDTDVAPVALYAVASTQIQLGRPEDAVQFFELLAARYPGSSYTQSLGLTLAEVYYELGDYQRAVNEIERRLPNLDGPAVDRAQLLLAESYNQLRDSDQAIIYYRRFTENNPDSPYYRSALYGLAWNYHREGAYQWAADHFGQVVAMGERDDLTAKAAYYQAVNTRLYGQDYDAYDLFQEASVNNLRGDLADHMLYELGITAYELRLWDEARDAFTRLINDYPNSPLLGEAYYRRGSSFIALGDFDGALSNFDRAIELEAAPASLRQEVLFQKAWLQYRNGDFRSSSRAFMRLYENNSSSELGAESLFWAAESFNQQGDLTRASRLFQQYLRSHSGGNQADAAHYALGWTHFKQGSYESAIAEFQRFLNQYRDVNEFVPYRTDAQLRLGDSYYALKRYPEAIRAYSRLGGDEGDDYALYQIGQAYYNAGEPFEAITTFRRLLSGFPESDWVEEAQYNLGFLYFQNENYDQAISTYQQLIRDFPRDPLAAKAQYGIGDALFNSGDWEDSVEAYKTVLDRYPNSLFASDAAKGIQIALIALGDEERAETIIDEFTANNPNSTLGDELRFRQAEVKYQNGQVDEALAGFQNFVRSSQNLALLPDAYFYLGSIFLERNKPQEAEAYLGQIISRHPSSPRAPQARKMLGDLLLNQNMSERALEVFQDLETANPDDFRLVAEARYGQAQALLQLNRLQQAKQLLEELSENSASATQRGPINLGLARVYEEDGRTTEAIELYRQVVDQNPDETGAESLYRLGILLLNRGQERAAIEELGRMSVLFGGYTDWVARGYLAQARAFTNLGQRGEAVRIYDQVIDEFSGTIYASQASDRKNSL